MKSVAYEVTLKGEDKENQLKEYKSNKSISSIFI